MNPVLDQLNKAPESDGGVIAQAISEQGTMDPPATADQNAALNTLQRAFADYTAALQAAKTAFGG
jgi:hypothetical protein